MKIKFKDICLGQIIKFNGKYAIKQTSKQMFIPSEDPSHIEFDEEQEFELEEENDNSKN